MAVAGINTTGTGTTSTTSMSKLAENFDQFLTLLDFPPHLFAKGWVDFEDLVRYNVNRGEYGPGDPEEQVRASIERAHNFEAHRIERQRPNGRWLEIRGTPIPSGGFVTSYVDITERKRIEAELIQSKESAEASREQVARLLDNSGEGFLSFGADLSATTAYAATCDLTAGSDADRGRVIAQKDGNTTQVDTDLLHTFASPGAVVLSCGDAMLQPAFWDRATITAIRVSSIAVTTTQVG